VTFYSSYSEPIHIAGDKLRNYDEIVQVSKEIQLTLPIEKTRKPLTDTLLSLEERGPTALGPAVLAAVTIASTHKGSKVVLCTDGNANVGIGSLENIKKMTETDRVSIENFYKKVGEFAAETGVSISVISIKGTDCSLEYLATVCDQTQGLNDIVDPLQLTTNFSSILENPVIATGVHVRMQLHNGLMFRPSSLEEENTIAESSCIVLKTIGNVTSETDCTFEYSSNLSNIQSFLGILDALPFQVQIHYTKLNGSKCIRVISKKKLSLMIEKLLKVMLMLPLLVFMQFNKRQNLYKRDYMVKPK